MKHLFPATEKTKLLGDKKRYKFSPCARLIAVIVLLGGLSVLLQEIYSLSRSKRKINSISTAGNSIQQDSTANLVAFSDKKNGETKHYLTDDEKAAVVEADIAALDHISFQIYNDYTKSHPVSWSPWSYMAEPHKVTYIRYSCGSPSCQFPGARYSWMISDSSGNEVAVLSGRETEFVFTAPGKYQLHLLVDDRGKRLKVTEHVMVKYVRREIRSLSDEDRNKFLDAMEIIYRLPLLEGKEKFGDSFRDASEFVSIYSEGVSARECDRWNGGSYDFVKNTALSLAFEQALQVIDPSISLPYWDGPMDWRRYVSDMKKSPIVDGYEWFDLLKRTDAYRATDEGQRAHVPLDEEKTNEVNGRHGTIPTNAADASRSHIDRQHATNSRNGSFLSICDVLRTCYRAGTIKDLNRCWSHVNRVSSGSEATILRLKYKHIVIEMEKGTVDRIRRMLWRAGFIKVSTHCSKDNSCIGSCPRDFYERHSKSPYDVLLETEALQMLAASSHGKLYFDRISSKFRIEGIQPGSEEERGFYSVAISSLCTFRFSHDIFSDLTPADPIFWLNHQIAERLLGLKRIKGNSEKPSMLGKGFSLEGQREADEHEIVCDWSEIRDDRDLPICHGGVCPGRRMDDILPLSFLIGHQRMNFSIKAFYALSDPFEEEIPYMYDSYEWPECAKHGIFFGKSKSQISNRTNVLDDELDHARHPY